MPFKVPSLDETRDLLVALGKALFSGLNFGSRRSYHGRRATYIAGAVTEIHAHVDSAARDAHPLTAGDGAPINAWGDATGEARKTATPARKASAGRVVGAAAATASIGDLLRHEESGLLFELASNVTIPGVAGVDPDSFVDADIVASEANGSVGSQTRLEAGAVLNFMSPPTGIQTNVVLQLDLDEDGFDAEQFGSYRARVLATFSQARSGGNQSDFVKWTIASLNTVAAAFAYPNRGGRGTIDVVGFYNGTGTARSLTPTDRDTVKAYIQTQAPFQVAGEGGGLRVLATVADPQDIEIVLEPNGQAAFSKDWDDSALFTVASWVGADRKLQFSATLPASLRAGHRLIFDGVASAQDGTEYKIESIFSANTVILEKTPPVAPAATDKIYSGGPLVTPVRDAIVAHLNGELVYAGRGLTPIPASVAASTGLSVVNLDQLAEGVGPANPGGLYNSANGPTWSGGIIRAVLFKIATYKAGVRNATIVLPASDYEATDDAFPLDDQIHYVTPGSVVIRYAYMFAFVADKLIAFDPPGAIGLPSADAAVLLRFDETEDAIAPKDDAGGLGDLGVTGGLVMPLVTSGTLGRARAFNASIGTGLVARDIESGSTLFTRDLTVQAVLRWDAAGQKTYGAPGALIQRGYGFLSGGASEIRSFAVILDTAALPSGQGSIRWEWQDVSGGDHVQAGAAFAAPAGFTMFTATRRWLSPTEVVVRYYVGDVLIGEATSTDGSIGGATIGTTQIGVSKGLVSWGRFLVGDLDELLVVERELTIEEIQATWRRITKYQPLGYQLLREMHDRGFPLPTDPASDVQMDLRMIGNALGYAAAKAEELRTDILPQRAYGSVLEDWEQTVRPTPAPDQGIDARRARVLARMRQRRGCSIDGIKDILPSVIGEATVEDLEFIAFSNKITDAFTTLDPLRWDVTPVSAVTAVSGAASFQPGAGDYLMDGATRNWVTMRETVGGDGKRAHQLVKLVWTTPQSNAEAGIYFGNSCTGDFLLLGLRDLAGSFRVETESFIAGVSQGLVQQAIIGANPAAIWFHLYQTTVDGTWKAAWSTTSATAGYAISADITHPTVAHWGGCYLRSTSPLGAGPRADFDDHVMYMPFSLRPFNAYVLLDRALGFAPDVDGARSVIGAIRHAFTHAAFITNRSLLADDLDSGAGIAPCGGY